MLPGIQDGKAVQRLCQQRREHRRGRRHRRLRRRPLLYVEGGRRDARWGDGKVKCVPTTPRRPSGPTSPCAQLAASQLTLSPAAAHKMLQPGGRRKRRSQRSSLRRPALGRSCTPPANREAPRVCQRHPLRFQGQRPRAISLMRGLCSLRRASSGLRLRTHASERPQAAASNSERAQKRPAGARQLPQAAALPPAPRQPSRQRLERAPSRVQYALRCSQLKKAPRMKASRQPAAPGLGCNRAGCSLRRESAHRRAGCVCCRFCL